MTTHSPGWELHRSFLAVLREGSLSGAARALGLTQPTIGRHIAALETALGLALFTRSPHGLVATEAAAELRPFAETMAASADALLRAASGSGHETRGTVRITASEVIGAEVVPSILAKLREAHPALVIELVLSNRNDDLLRRDADIAIRMLHPTQGALLARRVGEVPLGFHAHRRYLDRHGTPRNMEELRTHALIGFDRETASARALRARGIPVDREMFALRADSDLAQLAAIRAGFGIGICQIGLGRRDRDLVHLLPAIFALGLETFVVMHEDLRAGRRYRVVFDALVEGLASYIATGGPDA
ncbi:MAG: LysR family transcriptional regulator [Hyphomicrobiales bacterium]